MEELTVTQAEEYTKQQGKKLSRSYLVQAAHKGTIKARKVQLPTGVGYWMIDRAALDAYLAQPRKTGPKKGSHRLRTIEGEAPKTKAAA